MRMQTYRHIYIYIYAIKHTCACVCRDTDVSNQTYACLCTHLMIHIAFRALASVELAFCCGEDTACPACKGQRLFVPANVR